MPEPDRERDPEPDAEGPQPSVLVRDARLEDTDEVGRIQVRTWRAAYTGLIPDRTLDAMDATVQSASWSRAFRPGATGRLLVAERAGRVIGFAAYGPNREPDLDAETGELYAIYVAPEAWSTGAGRALMAGVLDGLRAQRRSRGVLRVLERNERARRFYEREGWTFERVTDPYDADGTPVPEVRYRRDL